jgi:cytochrome c-type biogenesis protein CcmH
MAGFWFGAGAMTVLALVFLLLPWWRERRQSAKTGLTGPLTALAVVPVALGLYLYVTTFDPEIAPVATHEDVALLEQLAARLSDDPSDVEGWMLLGRSYRELGDYRSARMAFEQAWNRSTSPDDALKINYAESMLFTEPSTALGAAGDLVEDVLETSPNNQRALFWGALVAGERGESGLAARRWAALLETNPPPEIAAIVQEQLASLASGREPQIAAAAEPSGPVIEIDVSVADGMPLDRIGADARLFIFARVPSSPAPIAVVPASLSELPGRFTLSDANAMLQGSSLASYDEVTIVARISASGQATEQPGDLYGEIQVDPEAGELVSLSIDKVVPPA